MERTLVIIKPDAVSRGQVGEVLQRFEKEGLKIRGLKMVILEKGEAERFYHVHRERPFFESLCEFMSSGPVVVGVLEGERAVARVRQLMGTTNPSEAEVGTIRRELGSSIERNAVHGSDSLESASEEIPFFFNQLEILS